MSIARGLRCGGPENELTVAGMREGCVARANGHPLSHDRSRGGFSLIELLVVIGILGLLMAVLLPALSSARKQAKTVVCRAQLKSLMTAIHTYAARNNGTVVPSYNMRGVSVGLLNPLDGWGPILDAGEYVRGSDSLKQNPFVCPETLDVAGMGGTQTGTNPENPKGYMDWPVVPTLTKYYAKPLPERGLDRLIRVAYWINGDNPIGPRRPFVQGIHFTGSVGYGPDPFGKILKAQRFEDFAAPGRLIALADGLYSGNQEKTRAGDRDSRIGYRHPGRIGQANIALADGHVEAIEGDRFPRKMDAGMKMAEIRAENLGTNPTVYSDPARFIPEVSSGE